LGFGTIARKVARKLSGFDVKIIAYDKYPNLEAIHRKDFDRLVRGSELQPAMGKAASLF